MILGLHNAHHGCEPEYGARWAGVWPELGGVVLWAQVSPAGAAAICGGCDSDDRPVVCLERFGLGAEFCGVCGRDDTGAATAKVFLWQCRAWYCAADFGETISAQVMTLPILCDGIWYHEQCGDNCEFTSIATVPLAMLLTFVAGVASAGGAMVCCVGGPACRVGADVCGERDSVFCQLPWAQVEVQIGVWQGCGGVR